MKANEYMSQLKAAFPKADAIYEDTIIDICGREGLLSLRESRMTYVDSIEDYVCRDCLEENYCFCDDCGEYFRSGDLTEHNGRWLCDSCLEGAEAQEEDDEEENSEANAEEQAI